MINYKAAFMAIAAPAAVLVATPATAVETHRADGISVNTGAAETVEHRRRNRHHHRDDYRYNSYDDRGYGEPVYANTRTWRGDDGRYYCRRSNGTTGLIIGGAAGALLGREVDSRGDRSLGTILGAAGGALLGREVERGRSRCR